MCTHRPCILTHFSIPRNSLEGLTKCLGPTLEIPMLWQERGPRRQICNQLPDGASAAGPQTFQAAPFSRGKFPGHSLNLLCHHCNGIGRPGRHYGPFSRCAVNIQGGRLVWREEEDAEGQTCCSSACLKLISSSHYIPILSFDGAVSLKDK